MKLLVAALAALQALENRFHDLVDPQGQIAKGVRDVAVAAADHVKVLEARLAASERHVHELASVIDEISQGAYNVRERLLGLTKEPAPPVTITMGEADAAQVPIDAPADPPAVVPIAVSPELAANMAADAQGAPLPYTDLSPGS